MELVRNEGFKCVRVGALKTITRWKGVEVIPVCAQSGSAGEER